MKWSEDLAVARKAIEETHPDPYTRINRAELDLEFKTLQDRLPQLAHHEIEVELARIVARIGDGHTRLTWPLARPEAFLQGHSSTPPPAIPDLLVHDVPVRFGIYEEGIFVEAIDTRHAELVGARLIAVGGYPLDEALASLTPVIRHDNESQLLDLLPMHLVLPEVLHARGLSPSRSSVTYTVEAAGSSHELRLEPARGETKWATLPAEAVRPLSWKHLLAGRLPVRGSFDRNYWFEATDDGRTLFVQFNGSENDGDETIQQFAGRMRGYLTSHPVERVVIDLRYNWGGDNSLNRSLLHALIASDRIRNPGSLFVLIGRGTFSAAMMFAVDLEKHLAPVFVGEPTGSSPVHFGDSRKTVLPNTGLTLRISSLFWQYSGPRDKRDCIVPQISVPVRWADQRGGRDAALDLLGLGAPAPPSGAWQGFIGQPGDANIPISCSFSSPRTCTLSGSPTTIDDLEVKKDGTVTFSVLDEGSRLTVSAIATESVIAGQVRLDGRPDYPLPFAMTPTSPP